MAYRYKIKVWNKTLKKWLWLDYPVFSKTKRKARAEALKYKRRKLPFDVKYRIVKLSKVI